MDRWVRSSLFRERRWVRSPRFHGLGGFVRRFFVYRLRSSCFRKPRWLRSSCFRKPRWVRSSFFVNAGGFVRRFFVNVRGLDRRASDLVEQYGLGPAGRSTPGTVKGRKRCPFLSGPQARLRMLALCDPPGHEDRHRYRPPYRMRIVFYLGNLHHKRRVCLVLARKTVVYERRILLDRDSRCDQDRLTRVLEPLTTRVGPDHFPDSQTNWRQESCARAPMPLPPVGTRRWLNGFPSGKR